MLDHPPQPCHACESHEAHDASRLVRVRVRVRVGARARARVRIRVSMTRPALSERRAERSRLDSTLGDIKVKLG